MGTNYYWTKREEPCPHCGRHDDETLHIGKSSGGWCFSLHIYPDKGITTLEDWEARFSEGEITDEYGHHVHAETMSKEIRERGTQPRKYPNQWNDYQSAAAAMAANHASPGPNNLWRHRIDDCCIGHGEGTWDYLICEFS